MGEHRQIWHYYYSESLCLLLLLAFSTCFYHTYSNKVNRYNKLVKSHLTYAPSVLFALCGWAEPCPRSKRANTERRGCSMNTRTIFRSANLTHSLSASVNKIHPNESLAPVLPNNFSHSYAVIFTRICEWNAPSISCRYVCRRFY